MSTIYGIINKRGGVIPSVWADYMLNACNPWPRDLEFLENNPLYVLGLLHRFNTPQSALVQSFSYEDSIYLLFDGRLDNRDDLAQKIGVDIHSKMTDEELILIAFKQYHTLLGEHLLGDFVIVIYHKISRELYILRDQLGVRPLFIAENEEYIAFASNKSALLVLPWVNRTWNTQWLVDTLTNTGAEHLTTLYEGIYSFPPAHWKLVTSNQVKTHCYWQLNINHQLPKLSDQDYIEEFKRLLFKAVDCRLRCYGEMASELSGGLDSTSIAAIAAIQLKTKSLHSYSHLLPPELQEKVFPFKDENNYIMQLCNQYHNINHYPVYSRNQGVTKALEYTTRIHSGLTRADLSRMGGELFTHLKANNRRSILSGFGGDQLVTSHGYGWDIELIAQKQWFNLYKEYSYFSKSVWKTLRGVASSLIKYHLNLIFGKRKYGESWEFRVKQTGINHVLAEKYGYPARYYQNPLTRNTRAIKEQEFEAITSPHVLYRLEDSAVGASSYGVDYRYPLLDIRLLQFCLALPSHLKVSKGLKRNMIRQATKEILPDAIRLRHDKTRATVPTVRMRILNDSELIKDLLKTIKTEHQIEQYTDVNQLNYFLDMALENSAAPIVLKQKNFLKHLSLLLWLEKLNGCK